MTNRIKTDEQLLQIAQKHTQANKCNSCKFDTLLFFVIFLFQILISLLLVLLLLLLINVNNY